MIGCSENGFMAIVLKVPTGTSNPRGPQHAHKCLEVSVLLAADWDTRFEVIHDPYHTFVIAHACVP